MRLTVVGLGLGTLLLASPASAAGISLGANAPIEVDDAAGSCATVTASGPFAGALSATGLVTAIVQDGVVVVVPIAEVQPFVGSDSTTVCTHGAPSAARGTVVYTITVASAHGDYAEVLICNFHGNSHACLPR